MQTPVRDNSTLYDTLRQVVNSAHQNAYRREKYFLLREKEQEYLAKQKKTA